MTKKSKPTSPSQSPLEMLGLLLQSASHHKMVEPMYVSRVNLSAALGAGEETLVFYSSVPVLAFSFELERVPEGILFYFIRCAPEIALYLPRVHIFVRNHSNIYSAVERYRSSSAGNKVILFKTENIPRRYIDTIELVSVNFAFLEFLLIVELFWNELWSRGRRSFFWTGFSCC